MQRAPARGRPLPKSSLAALFLLAWVAAGCSGSGGGGGTPTEPPPPPSPGIVVTPDGAASDASFSLRAGPGTGGDLLELELVATAVPPVSEIELVLVYPQDLLQFEDLLAGSFFGGDVTLVVQGGTGTLSILLGRTVAGTASGDGLVFTARFQGIGEGSGRLDLVDPEARDGDDLPVAGIQWVGGGVSVVL